MTNIIDTIISDKQDIKNQIGGTPSVIPISKQFNELITVRHLMTKSEVITYDGSANVFILNNPLYGVLGTNKLGDTASSVSLYSVVPTGNMFLEYFNQTNYIDTTNSTGTIDTSAETYTLGTGEILQSEVIAKLRAPITQVLFYDNNNIIDDGTNEMVLGTLKLGTSVFGAQDGAIFVSNDSGTTWYAINENEIFEFPTTSVSDELKYKVKATDSNLVIDAPIKIKIN